MPPLPPNADATSEEDEIFLSTVAPGDPVRELIHEVKNLRVAIKLAERTFIHRTEIEARFSTKEELEAAEHKIAFYRKQATRRIYLLIASVIAAMLLMGAGGGVAAYAYEQQQHRYQTDQFRTCLERNKQYAKSADFFTKFIAIQADSKDQVTAQKTIALLQEFEVQPSDAPKCERLKPH